MNVYGRREFLNQVGSGLLASVAGLSALSELELLGPVFAGEVAQLDFGALEPLVSLMQESAPEELIPKLKARLEGGTDLRTLVAAAALANARTFGGQDYIGYHCFMALIPAYAMAHRLSGARAALPVFKVLYRNAARIQGHGGRSSEVLRPVEPASSLEGDIPSRLLAAGRNGELDAAEAAFARMANGKPEAAFAALQPLIRDNIDVHQVVLAYRSWDMMRLAGEHNAQVLLRQAMRHCVDRDENRRREGREAPSIRSLLPRLVETYRLDRPSPGANRLTDAELDELARLVLTSERDAAAEEVAERLSSGVFPEQIGEALSLAAVRLLLRDPGRSRESAGKPKGSVHGASVGLHAADAANAWRGIAAATGGANANACLVTAAWHTAGQSGRVDDSQPHHANARPLAREVPIEKLLASIDEAVLGGDQQRACALVERYGEMEGDPEALLSLLIEPAILDDGALHHEKYFQTAAEEQTRTRPAFRFEHLTALARVLASGRGFEAEGIALSKEVLGI